MSRCLGFSFVCLVADADGRPVEVADGPDFAEARDRFLERVRFMLRGRPDLLDALGCLDNELEVRLHCGRGFYDEDDHTYFYGRVDPGGDHVVLEIATDEVLRGRGREALDVVIHEVTHVLDLLDGPPGLLPFWGEVESQRFIELRALEIAAIEAGTSPLDRYALHNAVEFLAVAVETSFAASERLAGASPELAGLLADYFNVR